jgi:hypothetical protein
MLEVQPGRPVHGVFGPPWSRNKTLCAEITQTDSAQQCWGTRDEQTELKLVDNVFSDYIRMKHILYIPYAAPHALNVSSKQTAGTAGVLWAPPGAVRA